MVMQVSWFAVRIFNICYLSIHYNQLFGEASVYRFSVDASGLRGSVSGEGMRFVRKTACCQKYRLFTVSGAQCAGNDSNSCSCSSGQNNQPRWTGLLSSHKTVICNVNHNLLVCSDLSCDYDAVTTIYKKTV